MAVPDPYLIFFFNAALFSFFTFYQSRREVFLWLFYLSVGLATLAKGPVAIGLPGLIILIFLIIEGKWRPTDIFQFKPFLGGALVLLIALPWYLAVHFQTEGLWTQEFFFKHNVNRFASPMEGHGGFFLLTPLMVLVGMLPFSVFVWHAGRMVKGTWKRPEIKFLTITTLTIVGFFSISGTKLPNYPVPAYPALAILLAQYLSYALEHNRISRIPQYILAAIGIALPWVLYFLLQKDPYFQHVAYVALWLLPLNVGSIASLYFCKTGKIRRSVHAQIIAWVCAGIFFFAFAYPMMDRENPVAKILPDLDQSLDFYHYKRFNAAFSFYLAKPIPQLTEVAAIQEKMAGGKAFYVISRRSFEEEFNHLPQLQKVAEAKDVYETPFTVIYLYKP
jgi:4-amino-4-deoxy-L-arabinose transferase-like glycosyltransferase